MAPLAHWVAFTVYPSGVAFFGSGAPMGGILLPRFNIGWSPIAYKYREGKVKRTLERGLKACEIVGREANTARSRLPGRRNQSLSITRNVAARRLVSRWPWCAGAWDGHTGGEPPRAPSVRCDAPLRAGWTAPCLENTPIRETADGGARWPILFRE